MGILTKNYGVDSAKSFYNDLASTSSSTYVFVGRPTPWTDDQSPPTANLSVESTNLVVYPTIAYGKRVSSADSVLMARRVQWTSNTVYAAYDHADEDLYSKDFYVVTDDLAVFKCLHNAGGEPSTIKPAVFSTDGFFQTSDGYVWKYLYSISPTTNSKHYSASYVPVVPNSAVAAAAVDGSIDFVEVESAGQNFTAHARGFLGSVVNTSAIGLSTDASTTPGAYTGAGIYLHSSPGGSQLARITNYVGGTSRLAIVDPPLSVHETLVLNNIQGTFAIADVMIQEVYSIGTSTLRGDASYGSVVQQSDSAAAGVVQSSNSTVVVVYPTTNTAFEATTPIYNTTDSGSLQTGTVTTTSGSANVVGAGTAFTTDYTVGQYVRVGPVANTQIRRVTSIANATHMSVTPAFSQSLTGNSHYLVSSAFTPTAVTLSSANGTIDYVNVDGQIVEFANVLVEGVAFVPGETVVEVNGAGDSQSVTGVVDYANASHLILSSISGSLTTGLYLLGSSSAQRAQIVELDSYPSVGVLASHSDFRAGWPARAVSASSGAQTGNAQVVTATPFPGELSEYVVGPQIVIEGDGYGATAYATVSDEVGLVNSVASVTVLDHGAGYTYANVYVSDNTAFGNSAVFRAIIAPHGGHGADAYSELDARYVSVSVEFDTFENELYDLPTYGSYRTIGLLRDPQYSSVRLGLSEPTRVGLEVAGTSGSFVVGEVAYQANTGAGGTVEWSNTNYVELSHRSGDFASGSAVVGLSSGATANVTSAANIEFSVDGVDLTVTQDVTSASMTLYDVDPAGPYIDVTGVTGRIANSYAVSAVEGNATANVVSITESGRDVSATFGARFTQTQRVAMTTNTGSFSVYERVIQDTSNASGVIISLDSDVDLIVSGATGSFYRGNELSSNNGATAVVVGVGNTTHLKLSSVTGDWVPGNYAINNVGIEALIEAAYPALCLTDSRGTMLEGSYNIVGDESGSIARAAHANSISNPSLVRDTGVVTYVSHQSPFTRGKNTREQVKLVLKY